MNRSRDTRYNFCVARQRGGSRLSLLIILFLLAVVGYSAYQYVPVAYQASVYKVFMQDTVNNAQAKGQGADWVEKQLRASASDYGVPDGATINVQQHDNRIEAHVQYTRPVPLPGYVYQYNFDHTVISNRFL